MEALRGGHGRREAATLVQAAGGSLEARVRSQRPRDVLVAILGCYMQRGGAIGVHGLQSGPEDRAANKLGHHMCVAISSCKVERIPPVTVSRIHHSEAWAG